MKQVNISKAVPGMILARDVKNKDGRHLMDAGTPLGNKEIRILRMWGILEIAVAPDSPDTSERRKQKTGKAEEKLIQFLNQWFGKNKLKEPHVKGVYDLCFDWYTARPESLSELLSRIRAVRAWKTDKQGAGIKADPGELLSDSVKLPALPQIYSEINAAVQDPKCSGKEIAEIVSKDTSLTATLLKIVNSAFYGFSEKVDSLPYAAMALGTRQICSLALGITVINYFKGLPKATMDMEAFWRHSLGCAIIAKNLATYVQDVDGERLFIGGLLHDIGRLIYLSYYPEASGAALSQAAKLNLGLNQVEPRYFNISHSEFGSRLADSWHLSPEISALIKEHHGESGPSFSREAAVVYTANWLATALGIGFTGETVLSKLNPAAWKVLDIPVSALEPVLSQTDRQLKEAIRFFL